MVVVQKRPVRYGTRMCRLTSKISSEGVFFNSIPTKYQLLRRCIPLSISEIFCIFCAEAEECLLHLLFFFPVMKLVWNNIALWISLEPDLV